MDGWYDLTSADSLVDHRPTGRSPSEGATLRRTAFEESGRCGQDLTDQCGHDHARSEVLVPADLGGTSRVDRH